MKEPLYRCGQSSIEDLTGVPDVGAYCIRHHTAAIPGPYDWCCTIRKIDSETCEVTNALIAPTPRQWSEGLDLLHKVGYKAAIFECVHPDGRITQTRTKTRRIAQKSGDYKAL